MTEPRDNQNRHTRELEQRIAATLDAGCARMDASLTQRLDRARRRALHQPGPGRRTRHFGPALAAASVALVAGVALLLQPSQPAAVPLTDDLDLLTRPEFEVFIQDPDFLAWVAETEIGDPQRPGAPQPGQREDQSG